MGLGEIGEALRRSTVHIRGAGRRRESSGSGVIWDSGGTVITNAHVAGTGDHSVDLWDGRSFARASTARTSRSPSLVRSGHCRSDHLSGDRVPVEGIQI